MILAGKFGLGDWSIDSIKNDLPNTVICQKHGFDDENKTSCNQNHCFVKVLIKFIVSLETSEIDFKPPILLFFVRNVR